MKKPYVLFIITLILLNILSFGSQHNSEMNNLGGIIIVPRDFPSIQEAIESATANDIIYVKNGVYRENIVIDKPLWLVGEDPNKVIIDGGGSDFTIILKAERVLITRFTIVGGGVKTGLIGKGIGLELNKAHNSRITNNVFRGNRMGIYLHSSDNVSITNNIIVNNREGIYLYDSADNYVANNIITDNEYFAIQLFSSTSNHLANNTISRNGIGIYLYKYSNENKIEYNKITDGGIFLIESTKNKILSNYLENRGLFVNLVNNSIVDNTLNGKPLIYLQEVSDYVIEDAGQVILFKCSNTTLRNLEIKKAGIAVILWNTNYSRIINGVFEENEIGIYIHSSSNDNIVYSWISENIIGIRAYLLDKSRIYGNRITDNRYGLVLEESYDNKITKNIIASNIHHGILILSSSRNIIHDNEFYNNSFNIRYHNFTSMIKD